jgi:hypothetical protein
LETKLKEARVVALINHRQMLIKQLGFVLLIVSLLFIYTTQSIYALSVPQKVYIDNQTDYDFYFSLGEFEDGFVEAHSEWCLTYKGRGQVKMSFWIFEYSDEDDIVFDEDDIAFKVYFGSFMGSHHRISIMTNEKGEIIYEVGVVK